MASDRQHDLLSLFEHDVVGVELPGSDSSEIESSSFGGDISDDAPDASPASPPLRPALPRPAAPKRARGGAAAGGDDRWARAVRQNFARLRDDSSDAGGVFGDGVIVGGDEEKAEPIAGQWEFHDFAQEDWTSIVEEATDDPDYCYLCACTQSDRELEGNPNLQQYIVFLVDNYSKMTRKILALQGQKIYNEMLRPYTAGKKPMRCQTIIDHLEKHAPTVRIQLEHVNRTLNRCLFEESKHLMQIEQGTQKTRLSSLNVNTFLKLAMFQNDITTRLSKIRPDTKK